MKFTLLILAVIVAVAVAQDATGTSAPSCHPCRPHFDGLVHSREAITVDSTQPLSALNNVTVLQPPVHPSWARKMKGNFTVTPLLTHQVLKARIPRKYRTDICTGCVVPVKVHPKLDPRNYLDKKGNVAGRKRVLPVEPEIRPRMNRRERRALERREARRAAALAQKDLIRPEFYPLSRAQKKAIVPEHHTKILRRLPNLANYYPAPKPNRLYNPPEGWPCDACTSSTGGHYPSPL